MKIKLDCRVTVGVGTKPRIWSRKLIGLRVPSQVRRPGDIAEGDYNEEEYEEQLQQRVDAAALESIDSERAIVGQNDQLFV